MCKSWCELIVGLLVLVFALFLWSWMYTQWIIVILAIVLIIHSFTCKKCFVGGKMKSETSMGSKPVAKKKRK